jgi:hypothetical protein
LLLESTSRRALRQTVRHLRLNTLSSEPVRALIVGLDLFVLALLTDTARGLLIDKLAAFEVIGPAEWQLTNRSR